ncbi:Uncharacterised protein [Vibrio cholerae]|nr:Uncharacterised protein [Vibrio cholerae]CSB37648.1 Uncharacterised protein [Vibrio cholerae]CSB41267.1 Uncharacterised protein [Vibrio cholerae]CSB75324.1 Uncharacterised protein [Vibrio cholerae]CSC55353.1 Uncharacterised protein [Vibrio cholerae]
MVIPVSKVPKSEPHSASKVASRTKPAKMSLGYAPRADKVPISRVRSLTDMVKVLKSATNTTIAITVPITPNNRSYKSLTRV